MRAVTLLCGPKPALGPALAELGVRGRVALVRAGYREDESADAALVSSLGLPAINLCLHARGRDVFAHDPDFASAYRARQQRLRDIQGFYRIRLEKTDEAARMIAVRYVEPELLAQEEAESVAQLRQIDGDHVARCTALRNVFDAQWHPTQRAPITSHRQQLGNELASCDALVIDGGHVASLRNRLEIFGLLELVGNMPVIGISAGAMVLANRIVLFHDFPPYGSDIGQVLDAGFGLVPGLVVLPDPQARLRLDDRRGISRFVRRMAPATAVALDVGSLLHCRGTEVIGGSAARLGDDGNYQPQPRWP